MGYSRKHLIDWQPFLTTEDFTEPQIGKLINN